VRWFRRRDCGIAAGFALLGLVFATASALLAVSSIVYAQATGGFPFYDPRLLRIYRWGFVLSLTGILFGICGLARKSSLRWQAPLCALGTLMFWISAAESE